MTSPSAITVAATRKHVEAGQRADIDHHAEGLTEQEIADQHAGLVAPQHARRHLAAPHVALVDHVVVQQRRGVHELHRRRQLDMAVALVVGEPAAASVSIGRSLLPPDEIRWLATSGIMATSEPVRDRMVWLTRFMSAATSATSDSRPASLAFSSKGMTRPNAKTLPKFYARP